MCKFLVEFDNYNCQFLYVVLWKVENNHRSKCSTNAFCNCEIYTMVIYFDASGI